MYGSGAKLEEALQRRNRGEARAAASGRHKDTGNNSVDFTNRTAPLPAAKLTGSLPYFRQLLHPSARQDKSSYYINILHYKALNCIKW
jgi:hypothetical protein